MSSLETVRCDTVRRLFTAYVAQHPDTVAPMLASDFTFSSPRDDHIGHQCRDNRHRFVDRVDAGNREAEGRQQPFAHVAARLVFIGDQHER